MLRAKTLSYSIIPIPTNSLPSSFQPLPFFSTPIRLWSRRRGGKTFPCFFFYYAVWPSYNTQCRQGRWGSTQSPPSSLSLSLSLYLSLSLSLYPSLSLSISRMDGYYTYICYKYDSTHITTKHKTTCCCYTNFHPGKLVVFSLNMLYDDMMFNR